MITIETLTIGAPILVAAVVGLYALATNYFDDKATAKRAGLKSAGSFWARAAGSSSERVDRTDSEIVEAGFSPYEPHPAMQAANEDIETRARELQDLAISLDTSRKILEGLRRSRRNT